MRKKAEILQKLKDLGKTEPVLVPGKVLSVDADNLTCDVEINGLGPYTCRLNAAEGSVKGFVVIPSVDSWIICARLDENGDENVMITATKVDRIISIQDKFSFEMDIASGFKLDGNGNGLKKTFEDLLDAILQMTVTTPSGPSGTPVNATSFQEIKTNLSKYLQ